MKKIILTVTNDLVYDQRMRRICRALSLAGYDVTLVGREYSDSPELADEPYKQKRLKMFWRRGKLFYLEYTIRLFIYLLPAKMDAICSIDLDSIIPGYLISRLRGKRRVFDAHELFCEMEEISSRPAIYKIWKKIEKSTLPHYPYGYTVSQSYVEAYEEMYGNEYALVRNATILSEEPLPPNEQKYILYQGAVNKGRCFQSLIPAMKNVDYPLVICGNGNFMTETEELIKKHQLQDKVKLMGYIPPDELRHYTQNALCGITLFDRQGMSNYLSLANRFFDYIHQGIPQLGVNFPEYRRINQEFPVAILLDEVNEKSISDALKKLVENSDFREELAENTQSCKEKYNWQREEIKLLALWKKVFEDK